jgi:hypothetical protein
MLGLALAPSITGLLLGVAALSAFLLRHPLETVLNDLLRGQPGDRTRTALIVAICYLATALAMLGAALQVGTHMFWPTLVAALALGIAQHVLSLRAPKRVLLRQAAGVASLMGLAPTIALAGGWMLSDTLILWGLLLAWAVPTTVYLSTRIRRARGERIAILPAVDAHVAGLTFVVALVLSRHTSTLMIIPLALMLARAAYGLRPGAVRTHASVIGVQEAAFSLMLVVGLTFGYWVS